MENLNSVCFVSLIDEIKPIQGADKIELCVVKGWECIIPVNTYKVGDIVICATTDAVIPLELSESLNVTRYLRSNSRVKTVKLRGVYSECLIIPLSFAQSKTKKKLGVGSDVMDILGVYKYEPPVVVVTTPNGRKIKYTLNENFKVYYKFPNIKNYPDIFNENDFVQITRKIHGTNARYGIVKKVKLSIFDKIKKFFGFADKWIDYEFVYGSHMVQKQSELTGYYNDDVWKFVLDKYNIKKKLWDFVKLNDSDIGSGIILYGEIYGPKIQKNYDYGLNELRFGGFDISVNDVYCETIQTYLSFNALDLPHVPILYSGYWSKEKQDMYVYNQYIEGTNIPHEGIVIKERSGDRKKVAKVINPDYLIYSELNNVGDSH